MRRWGLRGVAAIGLAALYFLVGCAGFFVYPGSASSSSSSSTADYVYVANATTDSVTGFTVGTGTLTAISSSTFSLPFAPTAVAVNPADSILFVAGNSLIYAFSIGSTGALTALNGGSAVGISDVVSMDISPDGQWLLALDGNSVSIDAFQINSTTGLLTQVSGASYTVSGYTILPRAIKFAPNGDLVFVALGTAGDLVFTFNTSTGALASSQQLAPASTTTSDNALAVSPGSSYLYIARSGTSGGLAVYTIGTNGALSAVSGSPFAVGTQPYSVALNPGGTDVYVANRGDNTISGFSIASSGTLTALSGSPYTGGSAVTALAADKSGDYLLAVANGGSPDLTLYTFDTTTVGKLDLSATTTTGTDPTGPVALAATH